MKAALIRWGALGLMAALAGCDGELPPPDRHQGMRAAERPAYSVNSSINEVMGPPSGVLPLVRVETSNTKTEPAKVQTIVGETQRMVATRPAASQPATRPATQVPARGAGDTTGQ